MSAAHRWCKTQGRECYRSGVGMLSVQGDQREVLCLSSEVTLVRGTHAELTAASGLTTNVQSLATPLGLVIADLFCRSRGHAAGFGPVEYNTEIAFVVCVDGNDLERIPISSDDYVDAGCNIFSQSDSIHCTGLSHQRCVANGYRAGFGPIGDTQQLFTLCFP